MSRFSMALLVGAVVLLHLQVVAALSLQMTFPPRARNNPAAVSLTANKWYDLTWDSTYPLISLEVWQGPNAKGDWAHTTLLPNVTNTTTTYHWRANVLEGQTRNQSMYFHLYNSNDPSCQGCWSNSATVWIVGKNGAVGSKDQGDDTNTGSSNNNNALKYVLGLGLGLGLPLSLAVILLSVWLAARKRKRNGAARDDGSATAEQLMDWKGARAGSRSASPMPQAELEASGERHYFDGTERKNVPHETGGPDVAELSRDKPPVEASAEQQVGQRWELEGSTAEVPASRNT